MIPVISAVFVNSISDREGLSGWCGIDQDYSTACPFILQAIIYGLGAAAVMPFLRPPKGKKLEL